MVICVICGAPVFAFGDGKFTHKHVVTELQRHFPIPVESALDA